MAYITLDDVVDGLVIYGFMWIVIFFLLFLSHLVEHDAEKAKNKNSDQTGSE